jgi:hypothetical protein
MLKILSCKNEGELYRLIHKERSKEFGSVSDCSLEDAVAISENISIFGDKNSYLLKVRVGNRNVVNEEDAKYLNQNFFTSLNQSPHLFFLNSVGAEFNKLYEAVIKESKDLKTIKIIKIEEKEKNDFPAELVQALQIHDKKNSWHLLLKELAGKDAEPIHGSCVFAYKSLLVYLNDTKSNSSQSGVKDFSWQQAKRNAISGKREKSEVQEKYFNLVLAYHKARLGELDLGKQLEKWVLEN